MQRLFYYLMILGFCSTFFGCVNGSGHSSMSPVPGNERGSAPVNEAEVNEYKRAVHKCYKTGGTRVVKINGKLRCYD